MPSNGQTENRDIKPTTTTATGDNVRVSADGAFSDHHSKCSGIGLIIVSRELHADRKSRQWPTAVNIQREFFNHSTFGATYDQKLVFCSFFHINNLLKSNIFSLFLSHSKTWSIFQWLTCWISAPWKKKHRTGRAFYSNDENKNNNKLSQRYSISINFPLNFECVIEYLS